MRNSWLTNSGALRFHKVPILLRNPSCWLTSSAKSVSSTDWYSVHTLPHEPWNPTPQPCSPSKFWLLHSLVFCSVMMGGHRNAWSIHSAVRLVVTHPHHLHPCSTLPVFTLSLLDPSLLFLATLAPCFSLPNQRKRGLATGVSTRSRSPKRLIFRSFHYVSPIIHHSSKRVFCHPVSITR